MCKCMGADCVLTFGLLVVDCVETGFCFPLLVEKFDFL